MLYYHFHGTYGLVVYQCNQIDETRRIRSYNKLPKKLEFSRWRFGAKTWGKKSRKNKFLGIFKNVIGVQTLWLPGLGHLLIDYRNPAAQLQRQDFPVELFDGILAERFPDVKTFWFCFKSRPVIAFISNIHSFIDTCRTPVEKERSPVLWVKS